jgi:hypothetical protein
MTQNYEQALQAERQARQQAEYDSVVASLGAAQSELDNAQNAYMYARQQGDIAGEADAQSRISRAHAHIVQLETGKETLDQQHQSAQQYQQTYPQRQMTHEEYLTAYYPQLTPEERDWLLRHRELIGDQRRQQELQATYYQAERAGLKRGSPEYFGFFEDRLDLNGKDHRSLAGKTYGLSAQQLEAAKIAGVSNETYAENAAKLKKYKAQGHYQDR